MPSPSWTPSSAPSPSPPRASGWRRAEAELEKAGKEQRAARLWNDYLARPVTYNGLLIDVAELDPAREASQGFLPSDIAEQVRVLPLDQSLLKTSLRGYQTFGAKFALVQERVILGDEMGLGKTMQSLAAMCHLAAEGATHFLVVCPASVVINWTREVERHTLLEARRLHLPGAKRQAAEQEWAAKGGVAVTTFEALRAMPEDLDVPIAMMVVDEAHYAKNPNALRTQAVSEWASRSRRALFLTGTPMENKVEEFRVLVGHLRPDVAENLDLADEAMDGTRFRERVAPVYLRRNQEDVLSELPDRLETQEWVALEGAAMRAYREAVQDGNFMAMRRAAFDPGTVKGSQKLRRLVEIVGEAADGGRKVIVFSYFRDVLETVAEVLAGRDGVPGMPVIGPLTGDIPPAERQAMVDELTNASGPAVLVSQIQAGGVGLNIQAASVVVIAEPQLTPSIEEQAIARAHRMGQVRPVDVHRLLCEDSVDQRVLELLAAKREAFDEYARRSDMASATPDAVAPAPRPNWGTRSWPPNAPGSRRRDQRPDQCPSEISNSVFPNGPADSAPSMTPVPFGRPVRRSSPLARHMRGRDVRIQRAGRVEGVPDPGEQLLFGGGPGQLEPACLERADPVLGRDRAAERGDQREDRVLMPPVGGVSGPGTMLTCAFPSATCPKVITRAPGSTAATARRPADQPGPLRGGDGDVELDRHAEKARRLRMPLPEGPQAPPVLGGLADRRLPLADHVRKVVERAGPAASSSR